MAHVNSTPARDGTSSASTSQGSTNSYVYDVFVNHRGPDVKEDLASHIYHRLTDFGLAVFLDQEVMERGEGLNPQIEGAIRTASLHVAIFSPNYAQSRWCLDELVQMLESGSTIIPVFYKVEPADLRWTRGGDGVYARALSVLEKKRTSDSQPRFDSKIIEKWRNALSAVADISGFELKDKKEWQLVEEVVKQVSKKVRKVKPPLDVAKYPTGLDQKIKDVDRTLSLQRRSEKATVLGIVGLGGVGKSTLARQLFNRERSNYNRSCVLCDVRSSSLLFLQNSLLQDLSQPNAHVNSVAEGIEALKRVSERAFIILDDIDHIDQMDALCAPVKDTIHVGSLILITSRNKDVLISAGIDESAIYTLQGLSLEHSQVLFCWHAFAQPLPVIGFEEVVKKFLHVCNGLPLSLKVIGALLRGKHDLKHWDAQLRKISKVLPEDIQNTLRISYDALDREEKQIFLDIACFFIGENRDTAIGVWDGSNWEGFLGLWKLENRCLVEVDTENCLRMHDHLRDLGRDIAENPEYPRRLCRFRKSFLLDVVSDQSPVRGISMVDGNDSEQSFQSFDQSPVHGNDPQQSFENLALRCNLSRLQILKAEGHSVERVFGTGQLPPLIYLDWKKCPMSSLPPSIPLKNLRVLHIEGRQLETLWEDESQAPLQLRELHIQAPLYKVPRKSLRSLEKVSVWPDNVETFPNEFWNLSELQSLHLRFSQLRQLPKSIGNLTGLQRFELTWCFYLQTLPESVGNLTGLQRLDLRHCFNLQTLPESVGTLTGLQRFDLTWCQALQTLPESVGNLTGLQRLDLTRCEALQTLPESVGNLTGLQRLDLSYCFSLQTLPESVGNLTGLQSLDLSGCINLHTLPESVGNLTDLQSLDLNHCFNLHTLPESVGNLTGLQHLDLSTCFDLHTLPESVGNLTGLQSLDLRGCSNLHTLPESVGNLTGLQRPTLPEWGGNLTGLQLLDRLFQSADAPRVGGNPDGPPTSPDAPRVGGKLDGPPFS